jgi:hypothetical protein
VRSPIERCDQQRRQSERASRSVLPAAARLCGLAAARARLIGENRAAAALLREARALPRVVRHRQRHHDIALRDACARGGPHGGNFPLVQRERQRRGVRQPRLACARGELQVEGVAAEEAAAADVRERAGADGEDAAGAEEGKVLAKACVHPCVVVSRRCGWRGCGQLTGRRLVCTLSVCVTYMAQ